MRSMRLLAVTAGTALALGAGAASAGTMHPELGAKLAGMGEHGIVNLQSNAAKGQLCWTFELTTKAIRSSSEPKCRSCFMDSDTAVPSARSSATARKRW